MLSRVLTSLVFLLFAFYCHGQIVPDSALQEVVIKAYFSDKPLLKTPASVSVINSGALENHSGSSLLPALNTLAGVRMEERSPGSYRLSIRGSLLRSPFGVRNVKVYFDDFILTDAGGNTYLNAIDLAAVSRIEVIRGPEGSVFGANTGGVVLINPASNLKGDTTRAAASFAGGSFGLFQEKVNVQTSSAKFGLLVNQSYQEAAGYRENSRFRRDFFHIAPSWKYSEAGSLKGFFLHSDLAYGTPGGLTLSQYIAEPAQARPEAVQKKAFVGSETAFYGISSNLNITRGLNYVIALSGSYTNFENAAIRNYEIRKEKTWGLRSYLQLKEQPGSVPFSGQIGIEAQRTDQWKDQYLNNSGKRGELTGSDFLKARQSFAFLRASADPLPGLTFESALSYNLFSYLYSAAFPFFPVAESNFKRQLLPRIAASYRPNGHLAIRASLSKGYSAPTLEEVKPSGQALNSLLQAEQGWNREVGVRLSLLRSRLYLDAVYFNYHLNNAIVRRVDANEAEFYVNAGSTRQRGFESELSLRVIEKNSGFLKSVIISNSITLYNFRFADYTVAANDYSNNKMTGVPSDVVVNSVLSSFANGFSLFAEHNYTSSIPLNDANTFSAAEYHLFNARLNKKLSFKSLRMNFFAGADNISDRTYSLGNDLNAAGNRFYNAAARRNCYLGLSVSH